MIKWEKVKQGCKTEDSIEIKFWYVLEMEKEKRDGLFVSVLVCF